MLSYTQSLKTKIMMAAASQTITDRIKCQRSASRWPIKDISSGSGSALLRRRLKNFFLSDDSIANVLQFARPYKIHSNGDCKGKVLKH